MALLTNVTILLVLACISHQVMLGSCQKSGGRRGRGMDKGQHKNRSGAKVGRQTKPVSAQLMRGKVVTKDKFECAWVATGEDIVILSITCKKDRSFSCEYIARPTACPEYASNVKLYWKQIGRELKKLNSLCQDSSAFVRAGMCRRAAREAHFRLNVTQRVKTSPLYTPTSPVKAVKSCQADNRKRAEEFCNNSWSSVCTFLFTMVRDYDCWYRKTGISSAFLQSHTVNTCPIDSSYRCLLLNKNILNEQFLIYRFWRNLCKRSSLLRQI